jgi:hypothetical protein
MNLRIPGWCRLSYIGFSCIASVIAGCAADSPDRTGAVKPRPGNAEIGKASYNQSTLGFEKPWPFGAGPGAGVNTDD